MGCAAQGTRRIRWVVLNVEHNEGRTFSIRVVPVRIYRNGPRCDADTDALVADIRARLLAAPQFSTDSGDGLVGGGLSVEVEKALFHVRSNALSVQQHDQG